MPVKIKSPLMPGEEIVMSHIATFLNGFPRPSGYLVLTNQRIFFEKKGAMNAAAFGLLSLAMKDFNGIPLSEIASAHAEKSIAGAGLSVTTRTGEEFKFALNGFGFSSKEKPRDDMLSYINSHVSK